MDKKKMSVVLVVLLLSMWSVTANPKFYSDKTTGYSGYAEAAYRGTVKTIEPYDEFVKWTANLIMVGIRMSRDLVKLTKQEEFLIGKALNEYVLKDGEVYIVIATCANSVESLALVVSITDDGKNFRWYGGFYTND